MPVPTIYFPSGLKYKIGFQRDQVWSTDVSRRGPSGRTQRFKNWTQPVRRMRLTVLGLGGTGSISETTNKTMRQFLYSLGGRYTPFYIFNPKSGNYDSASDPAQTLVGTYAGAFPMVCPFSGGTISLILKNGASYRTPGQFTTDAGGPGGETRITAVDNPQPINGDIITVNVTGAYERIPAVQADDIDLTTYDWTGAEPPTEYQMDLEEDFG